MVRPKRLCRRRIEALPLMCGRHPTAVRNSDQNNNMSIDLKQETPRRGGDFGRGRGPFRRELMRSRERTAAGRHGPSMLQLLRMATEVLGGRQRTRIVRRAARAVVYCRWAVSRSEETNA